MASVMSMADAVRQLSISEVTVLPLAQGVCRQMSGDQLRRLSGA